MAPSEINSNFAIQNIFLPYIPIFPLFFAGKNYIQVKNHQSNVKYRKIIVEGQERIEWITVLNISHCQIILCLVGEKLTE